MMFEIQLMSSVPEAGALTIGVPKGFRFPFVCRPTKMNSYASSFLPVGHECSYIPRADDEGGTIWIYPGPLGLNAQTYVFTIIGTNPQETSMLQADQLMPCGFSMCWRFASLADATDLTSYRDMPTYATGFAINRKMIQARLPLISKAVRAGTGRNDKPNEPNQLIFSFSLNDDLLEDSELVLRGPYGFRFAEDCVDQIVTAEDKVFGEGNKWPPEYDPWEPEAQIMNCRGELTDAHIKIEGSPRREEVRVQDRRCIEPRPNPAGSKSMGCGFRRRDERAVRRLHALDVHGGQAGPDFACAVPAGCRCDVGWERSEANF